MKELFYDILVSGLWGEKRYDKNKDISDSELKFLLEIGFKQAVEGILAVGIDVCNISNPRYSIRWINRLVFIENNSKRTEILGQKLLKKLAIEGIKAEIFKGPSIAKWYREPGMRSYGDIDLVIYDEKKRIIQLLKRLGVNYILEHEDVVCNINGITVEFHRQRDFTYCPKDNRTLQSLVSKYPESQEVYLACLIVHFRRHLLTYGIGMKQVCDIAVLLKSSSLDMNFMAYVIKVLNMEKFCAALFGFIKRRLNVEIFPIEPNCGYYSFFIENIVWIDGYQLKIDRSNLNKNLSNISRITKNTIFWIKRCCNMINIMPREAIWFIPFMIKRRVLKG